MNTLRMTPEQVAAHQARIATGSSTSYPKPTQKAIYGPVERHIVPAAPKPSKYRSRPTGGYSSAKEARRATALHLMEKAGEIRDLREQVSYELIPRQYIDGKMVEREVRYVADFVYRALPSRLIVVEDCKGWKGGGGGGTYANFVIKRKLMLQVHGIRIRET